MFRKLRNAIARRRDMRLRKWCVKQHKDCLDAEMYYWFILGHNYNKPIEKQPQSDEDGGWGAEEDGGWINPQSERE